MRRAFAVLVTAVLTLIASTSAVAQTAGALALVADAFGVEVGVDVGGTPLPGVGPVPQVSVAMPPQSDPVTDVLVDVPAAPLATVALAEVTAEGDLAAGTARAEATTGEVVVVPGMLPGTGLITADGITAVANNACPARLTLDEASAGTEFVNLVVGGQPIPLSPPPNTVLEIPNVARVIVNEVLPDAEAIGATVRGLHVFTLDPLTGAVDAEVIIAEAHSAVV